MLFIQDNNNTIKHDFSVSTKKRGLSKEKQLITLFTVLLKTFYIKKEFLK